MFMLTLVALWLGLFDWEAINTTHSQRSRGLLPQLAIPDNQHFVLSSLAKFPSIQMAFLWEMFNYLKGIDKLQNKLFTPKISLADKRKLVELYIGNIWQKKHWNDA